MTCPLINSTFSVLANDLCYKSEAGGKNTLGCAVIENPSLQSANNNSASSHQPNGDYSPITARSELFYYVV